MRESLPRTGDSQLEPRLRVNCWAVPVIGKFLSVTTRAIIKTAPAIPGQYAGRLYDVDEHYGRAGEQCRTGCRNTAPAIADAAAGGVHETTLGTTVQA
jgi:hypothetical protein